VFGGVDLLGEMVTILRLKMTKRTWRDIFLSVSLGVGGTVVIVGCFIEIPGISIITNIFYGFLGAGITLAGFTIPENISQWKNKS
jgi:hypothetical protein